MRTRLFILLCFLLPVCLPAQTPTQPSQGTTAPPTTAPQQQTPSANEAALKENASDIKTLQSATKQMKASVDSLKDESTVICHKCEGDTSMWNWFIVIIAIIFLAVLLIVLLGSKFNLKDALSENINDKIFKPNPEYKAETLMGWLDKLSAGSNAEARATAERLRSAAETAAQNRKAAEEDYNNKKAAASSGDDANAVAARDAAKVKFDEAVKAEAKANGEAQEASKNATSVTVNPAVLVNLAALFPPTIEVSKDSEKGSYRPSASRLIAFLSGILILVVGMGMTCFYIYFYLNTGCPPDLSRLTGVLVILGVGMAPYTINKVVGTVNKQD